MDTVKLIDGTGPYSVISIVSNDGNCDNDLVELERKTKSLFKRGGLKNKHITVTRNSIFDNKCPLPSPLYEEPAVQKKRMRLLTPRTIEPEYENPYNIIPDQPGTNYDNVDPDYNLLPPTPETSAGGRKNKKKRKSIRKSIRKSKTRKNKTRKNINKNRKY